MSINYEELARIRCSAELGKVIHQPMETHRYGIVIGKQYKRVNIDRDLWLWAKSREYGWLPERVREIISQCRGENITSAVNKSLRAELDQVPEYRSAMVKIGKEYVEMWKSRQVQEK